MVSVIYFSLMPLLAISEPCVLAACVSVITETANAINRLQARISSNSQWLPKLVGQERAGDGCVPAWLHSGSEHGLALRFYQWVEASAFILELS